MAYAITLSTVYDAPESRNEATASWSGTFEVYTPTSSSENLTGTASSSIWRSSTEARQHYTSGSTWSGSNSTNYPPDFGLVDQGGDFVNQTFQNRTRTQIGTDSTIVPVSMQGTATLGTTTQVVENPPNRSVTEANETTALRWTTDTFDVTDANPTYVQTDFYQIETTVPTLWALFDSAPGGRLITANRSTFVETIATVTCDTYQAWFPDYGKKMYARPTALFPEITSNHTSIISSEIPSYGVHPFWASHPLTRQMQSWPNVVLENQLDEFSSLQTTGPFGEVDVTRQFTSPLSNGRQLVSGTATSIASLTGDGIDLTMTTNVILLPAEGPGVWPRTIYRTTQATVQKSTSLGFIFEAATFYNTFVVSGLKELAQINVEGPTIMTVPASAVDVAERGATATLTTDERRTPIFGYRTTIIPIEDGVASGYERNAAIPTLNILPPPGIGFSAVPAGWEEAHRAIRYSTVYREAYSNISRGGLGNAVRDVVCPITTQGHRVGTFGSVVDGVWVAGFTGTEYKATLDFDSVTFAKAYTTLVGGDTVKTSETIGFTFSNILAAHTAFRKVGGIGHKYNPVSSFVDGSYAYTSGTDMGTSFGPLALTVPPNQTYSAKALTFLTAIPTNDPGYIEL